ncbi:MAG: response regulator [Flavobacteriales bacterium]|nr:response regulator [Flavobacteriales bacterium]
MLVEDNEATNITNTRLLKGMNIANDVVATSNGKEAIAYLKDALERNQRFPELIFLGLYMPIMNGLDFFKELNSLFKNREGKPEVVLLSRSNSVTEIEIAKKLGAHHH